VVGHRGPAREPQRPPPSGVGGGRFVWGTVPVSAVEGVG